MSNKTLYNLVANTGDLAALPTTVVDLLYLFRDEDASARSVVAILHRDPAMTANVLKMSNSAFYGARREISSVQDALVMLGNRAVVTMAFASGMAPVMRRDLVGYNVSRSRFWNHSLLAASASSFAAERMGYGQKKCEVFTAGLVHDVGMLVIDAHLVGTRKTLVTAEPAFDVSGAERRLLGFDHCEAGAMLAETWGFPAVLCQAIEHHHDPRLAPESQDVVRAVAVGNLLALIIEQELDPHTHPLVAGLLKRLDLEAEFVAGLREDLGGQQDEIVANALMSEPCPA
ncbi:MAG: HDOD domain-containing protein [Candidatus Krumholzibacteriota bacterium]